MLDTLITSKTRIKLLIKFFLNPNSRAYLRNLEQEFDESSNSIRLELNKFEEANLLKTELEGNKKYFSANISHPLFPDIHNILLKHLGIDQVIEEMVLSLGNLKKVYLVGDIAKGRNSNIIDLLIVGTEINREYLMKMISKAEKLVNRKVRYIIYDNDEVQDYLESKFAHEYLLLFEA